MKKMIPIIFILLIFFTEIISLANDTLVYVNDGDDKEYNLRQEEAKKIINSISSNSNNEAINNNDKRIVYVTSTGSVYHLPGCSKLDSTPHSLTVTEATNKGYAPCKKCNPYNLTEDFYKDTFNPYILLGIIPLIFIILILLLMKYSSKSVH